jgi:hypothetical protein
MARIGRGNQGRGLLANLWTSTLHLLNRLGALTTSLVVCFWVVLAIRAIPVPAVDYGMFVTVAERLIAGDRLYADVYENKDPFFHYSLALARSVTPYGGWLLELVWLVAASVAGFVIARWAGIAFRTAVTVGFIAVPAIMTGFTYWAGVSHLPGVALSLLALALALRRKSLLAGVVLGCLPFFKVVMFPVGVLIVTVAIIITRQPRQVARVAYGLGLAALAGVLLMLARGELLPYAEALRDNTTYASSMETASGLAAAIEHVTKVLVPNNLLMLGAATLLLLAGIAFNPSAVRPSRDPVGSTILWAGFAATAVALAVLSQTGLWIHHAQILIPGTVLALVFFMSRGPAYCRGSSGISILTAVALAVPLSGIPSPRAYVTPVEYAQAIWWEQTQLPPATRAILGTGTPTTFARIGGGNDGGFGRGLGDWTLACPIFGQSTITTPVLLEQTLDCLPSANVIFVDSDAVGGTSASPWDSFIMGAEELLSADYSCRATDGGRICVKQGLNGS